MKKARWLAERRKSVGKPVALHSIASPAGVKLPPRDAAPASSR